MKTINNLILVTVIVLLVLFSCIYCDRTYSSHQNLVKCTGSQQIQYPNSILEISSLVKTAAVSNTQVKALGTLHSITDILCTDGLPISMIRINHAIYNPLEESATFGAGIGLSDASTFLEEKGRSFIHTPAWGLITLGGALATGAHGSTLRHPTTISDQVIRLTFVDGNGSLVHVEDSSDLQAFEGHLGLLGIIVEVTLRTVPLFKMTLTNSIQSDKVLFSGDSLGWARQLDFLQFFWFPFLGEVVTTTGTYVSSKVPGNAKTNLVIGPMMGYGLMAANAVSYGIGNHALFRLIHSGLKRHIAGKGIGVEPLIRDNGTGVNPGTGYAWRLQSHNCPSGYCAWDYETFQDTSMTFDLLPFEEVLALVQNTAKNSPELFHEGFVLMRFLKASTAFTSTSGGKDSFVVEWVTSSHIIRSNSDWAKKKVDAYDNMMRQMVDKYGGRPHWGKKGLCYFRQRNFPKLNDFVTSVRKWDPTGTFQNEFFARVLNIVDADGELIAEPFCSYHQLKKSDFSSNEL